MFFLVIGIVAIFGGLGGLEAGFSNILLFLAYEILGVICLIRFFQN